MCLVAQNNICPMISMAHGEGDVLGRVGHAFVDAYLLRVATMMGSMYCVMQELTCLYVLE
jgi:alkylhydroperoxidase family enzyme